MHFLKLKPFHRKNNLILNFQMCLFDVFHFSFVGGHKYDPFFTFEHLSKKCFFLKSFFLNIFIIKKLARL